MSFDFSSDVPSDQAALDIYKGKWVSRMPEGSGLIAGDAVHFEHPVVQWASVMMPFQGKHILEIGPLEAYNTYAFEQLGAEVTAIENSAENFLKCLIIKNLFGVKAKFLYGDCRKFTPDRNYDIVWASGVLYHLTEPLSFLEQIAGWSDTLFIWTQYFDGSIITPGSDNFRFFDSKRDKMVRYRGRDIRLHWRSYLTGRDAPFYSGGSDDFSYWMERDDLFFVLNELGFSDITRGYDNPDHASGPACYFFAKRG